MLRLRIVTAVVLAVVFLWAIYDWTAPALGAFLLLAAFCCAWEWSLLLGIETLRWKVVYAVTVCLVTAILIMVDSVPLLRAMTLLAVLFWITMTVDLLLRPVVAKPESIAWGRLAFATTVLIIAVVSLFWMREIFSAHSVVFVVALVAAADTGAYFCGRAFGKQKLAERISSGKTVEGAIGGVVLAMCLAFVVIVFFPFHDNAMAGLLFFSLVAAVFSIAGDLYVSRAKRTHGVKDSGHLLPGHGGVLDRFDGLLAAVPWMAFALLWL